MDKEISQVNEDLLYLDISQLIEITQQRALYEINRAGVLLYWHIGRRINHDILKCNRAEYGASIIKTLADKLQTKFGRGFGLRVMSNRVGGASQLRPLTPPYVRCRIRRFQLNV